jgi:hypothetical protein
MKPRSGRVTCTWDTRLCRAGLFRRWATSRDVKWGAIMNSLHSICYSMGLLAGLAGCAVPSLPGPGKVYVDHGADIRGDERRVQEILAAFNQAEEALQTRNLDELMRLYSRDYAYHGLSKDDLRKIWWDLLAHYSRISSTHIVSGIKVMESGGTLTAEVTCTGSLRTTSDMTGERVNIDSWFYEVHRLIYEDGAWRIRGHVGEAPKALQFVASPHPLF